MKKCMKNSSYSLFVRKSVRNYFRLFSCEKKPQQHIKKKVQRQVVVEKNE